LTRQEFQIWRVNLGMNKTEAADALGVSRNMPLKYEDGSVEIPRYIELACKYLEVEPAIRILVDHLK
jgi:DNA-binding XRE family transcriptional regulator